MLNCWDILGSDCGAMGADGCGLITRLLLDDVGIARGACSQTTLNEYVMQIDQRCHTNPWCADLHARADHRIEDPGRYNDYYAGRSFNVSNWTRGALLDAAQLDPTPVQRMPTVMDLDFLPDMGRMTG